MVLKKLVEDEIKQLGLKHLEDPDYGERLDNILDSRSSFPAGDRGIENQLEEYGEELEDKEVEEEQYISKLEDILESEPDYFKI